MTTIILVLCAALAIVSVSSAVVVYFVCQLVTKVTRLQAAGTVSDYLRLGREENIQHRGDDVAIKVPVSEIGQLSDDGTLNEEALTSLRPVL